jgi:hypothetical protein
LLLLAVQRRTSGQKRIASTEAVVLKQCIWTQTSSSYTSLSANNTKIVNPTDCITGQCTTGSQSRLEPAPPPVHRTRRLLPLLRSLCFLRTAEKAPPRGCRRHGAPSERAKTSRSRDELSSVRGNEQSISYPAGYWERLLDSQSAAGKNNQSATPIATDDTLPPRTPAGHL